eukprot:UN10257
MIIWLIPKAKRRCPVLLHRKMGEMHTLFDSPCMRMWQDVSRLVSLYNVYNLLHLLRYITLSPRSYILMGEPQNIPPFTDRC